MPAKPCIVVENWEGKHNTPERYQRYKDMGLYRNLSTVWFTPTRGTIAAKVVSCWMTLSAGFNQPLCRMFGIGQEVGEAYNNAIKEILANPFLAKFQYLLTVEEDNTPPPDGLLRLYESIQEYDWVSGLYWTKGPDGAPQIWGDPKAPGTYAPQPPFPETIQRCNGTGMGFTLFRLDMFRDPKFEQGAWFKTGNGMTQDLYFAKKAGELGYKCAVDTRCRVGHYSVEEDIVY
jgi:hypothetical protein